MELTVNKAGRYACIWLARADKTEYTKNMRMVMENTEHLTLRQAEVAEIIVEDIEVNNNDNKDKLTEERLEGYMDTLKNNSNRLLNLINNIIIFR